MNQNNTIHIVLQGKGGVGKTFVSWILAQYLSARSEVVTFDLDPVNPTFSRFGAFRTTPVRIIQDDNTVDSKALDALVEMLVPTSVPIVIDTGASSFVPFLEYLRDQGVLDVLEAAGKRIVLHTVVTAGAGLKDCLAGAGSLLDDLTSHDRPAVIWANEFFGPLSTGERQFKDFKLITSNANKLHGLMVLTKRSEAFLGDLRAVTSAHKTIAETLVDPTSSLMTRQRLKMLQADYFAQLDTLFAGSN